MMRSYSRKEIFESRVDEKTDAFVDEYDRDPTPKELDEIHTEAMAFADEWVLQYADWLRDCAKDEKIHD